ncbi:hypothetical protein [Allocoleopsis franciscana]|uniref:Uncharacterized protein n=1 Tax=Allocoleopsis franciscana PCC 7113 TaxID=1173027 RepID=K9WNA7_9CYAN|nr:hypothetical protein [Allocoleopsis franciscana]AFZ21249.1 hypothetical protein Mic7113_5618 [Allocoleopsis franciscana PCC 7113]
MTTVTPAEIEKFRSQLTEYPEAIAALDEIEMCEGDLEAAAYVLAINAGEEVVRSDPKWLDRFAQKCRRVICQEEFKDELLPDLSRELVAALIGVCCKNRKPLAINSLSGLESCSAPRKSGRIPQNPCTKSRENVQKSFLKPDPTGKL